MYTFSIRLLHFCCRQKPKENAFTINIEEKHAIDRHMKSNDIILKIVRPTGYSIWLVFLMIC